MLARVEQLIDGNRRALRIVVFGFYGVNIVMIIVGLLATNLHDPIDRPVFDSLAAADDTWLSDILRTVTKMGNEWPTLIAAVGGGLLLTLWLAFNRSSRWWVPVVFMPAAWFTTRGFLLIVTDLVPRPRDEISITDEMIGGYPSGGVTRTIVVYGLLAFLASHYGRLSPTATRLVFATAAILGLAEALARFRLNQHWVTDVIAGLPYGTMLVVVAAATIRALDPMASRS